MMAMACAFAAGIASVPAVTVKAAGDVEINETNFPDDMFREFVKKYDKDEDNKLSGDEIKKVKKIDIQRYDDSAKDLKGIEYFTYLTDLYIIQYDLESLDLSKNVNLSLIYLAGKNNLSTLDLSKNTKIEYVSCVSNDVKNLILPKDCVLDELDISETKISDPDLSNCRSVKHLKCRKTGLTSFPDFKCFNIERIDCSDNEIKQVDLSNCPNLRHFNCQGNKLEKIDVSMCKNLQTLYVNGNSLTSLDVSKNTKLITLFCDGNKLTSLDLTNNPKLKSLTCESNALTSLDISNNDALERFDCSKNKITKLDISSCPKLVTAYNEGGRDQYGDDDDIDNSVISRYWDDNEDNKHYWICFDKDVDIICSTISVTAKSKTVVCGKTTTCKVDSDTAVTWLSSDENIATVDSNGKVKAKMAGLVTITAQTSDNVKAKVNITVLYKDVTNSKAFWYLPTNRMTALGVVKGYNKQTLFKPANKCTRAQMVTFMWRLVGEPEPQSDTCKFSDVKKTDYFYKPCIWGNENHIVEGYKDGTFGPQIICARKHAVTFLWRLAGCPKDFDKNKFSDVKKSDYYYDPVRWASRNGILEGYKDGTFRPDGECLRRQMVTFLDRYNQNILRLDS